MKRKEMLIFGAVGFVAAILSFVVSDMIFGNPKKQPIKVPVVQVISTDFPIVQSDENYKKIFHKKAINPTQLIKSGGGNTKPFQGGE